MRLIDADALIETSDVFIAHTKEYGSIEVISVDAVGDAPTIDAVPVVRCRECDHKTHDGNGRPYCLQLEMYLNKELDFFCKYGERKGGTDNG